MEETLPRSLYSLGKLQEEAKEKRKQNKKLQKKGKKARSKVN